MLSITGISRRDQKLVRQYYNFVMGRFCKKNQIRDTKVVIRFIHPEELTSATEQKELKVSEAWMESPELVATRRDVSLKDTFLITLNKKSIRSDAKKQITQYKNLLKYLGHELVHLKQYINKELIDLPDGRYTFMKKTYSALPDTPELTEEYWDSPYEIEAYGRMEGLYQMFLNHLKSLKK